MDEKEEYNLPNPLYYNYGIKHILINDIDDFEYKDEYDNILLCIYKVNTSTTIPFLEYLLANNGYELLSLPKLPVYTLFNKDSLVPYSKVFLSGILQSEFQKFSELLEFDGFYEFNNNLYLFFDVTNCGINIDEVYLSSRIRFVLIDEIINHRNICNIPIDNSTTNFFLCNESLIYLYDKNNEAYEIPIVGFTGKPTEINMKFCSMFGETPKDKNGIMGPYYYFTNFKNAIRKGGWSQDYKMEKMYDNIITDENGKYIKGGIVRFALFTGSTKYIENAPNDPIDDSLIKKARMEDENMNQKFEMLTIRISDHDGIWTKTYDSVYLGNLELDDGSILEDAPMIVLKNYEQQVPLSLHYINKQNLDLKYDSNKNYNIL